MENQLKEKKHTKKKKKNNEDDQLQERESSLPMDVDVSPPHKYKSDIKQEGKQRLLRADDLSPGRGCKCGC